MRKFLTLFLLVLATQVMGQDDLEFFKLRGSYVSDKALHHEVYMMQELSKLDIYKNGFDEYVAFFGEYDLEGELVKEKNQIEFYIDMVSECEDYHCKGISEMSGVLSSKMINGIKTPVILLTAYFYQDISDEGDLEFKTWSEEFEYILVGESDAHKTEFEETKIENCDGYYEFANNYCIKETLYKFTHEISKRSLLALEVYTEKRELKEMKREKVLQILQAHIDLRLLMLENFDLLGRASASKVEGLKRFYAKTMSRIRMNQSEKILVKYQDSTWGPYNGLDFFFVNKNENIVTRFTVQNPI